MLRRIIIILAAAMAALTLTTIPAGAGSSLEMYSLPSFSGTHASVPSTTVDGYLNSCVSTYALTATVLTTAQSAENYTDFDLRLYAATGCSLSNYITTVNPYSTWSTSSNELVYSVYVAPVES